MRIMTHPQPDQGTWTLRIGSSRFEAASGSPFVCDSLGVRKGCSSDCIHKRTWRPCMLSTHWNLRRSRIGALHRKRVSLRRLDRIRDEVSEREFLSFLGCASELWRSSTACRWFYHRSKHMDSLLGASKFCTYTSGVFRNQLSCPLMVHLDHCKASSIHSTVALVSHIRVVSLGWPHGVSLPCQMLLQLLFLVGQGESGTLWLRSKVWESCSRSA